MFFDGVVYAAGLIFVAKQTNADGYLCEAVSHQLEGEDDGIAGQFAFDFGGSAIHGLCGHWNAEVFAGPERRLVGAGKGCVIGGFGLAIKIDVCACRAESADDDGTTSGAHDQKDCEYGSCETWVIFRMAVIPVWAG